MAERAWTKERGSRVRSWYGRTGGSVGESSSLANIRRTPPKLSGKPPAISTVTAPSPLFDMARGLDDSAAHSASEPQFANALAGEIRQSLRPYGASGAPLRFPLAESFNEFFHMKCASKDESVAACFLFDFVVELDISSDDAFFKGLSKRLAASSPEEGADLRNLAAKLDDLYQVAETEEARGTLRLWRAFFSVLSALVDLLKQDVQSFSSAARITDEASQMVAGVRRELLEANRDRPASLASPSPGKRRHQDHKAGKEEVEKGRPGEVEKQDQAKQDKNREKPGFMDRMFSLFPGKKDDQVTREQLLDNSEEKDATVSEDSWNIIPAPASPTRPASMGARQGAISGKEVETKKEHKGRGGD